jgi:hypothetical protein
MSLEIRTFDIPGKIVFSQGNIPESRLASPEECDGHRVIYIDERHSLTRGVQFFWSRDYGKLLGDGRYLLFHGDCCEMEKRNAVFRF